MKSLEQALHDALWKICADIADVYEHRPMSEVKYPFIDFGDTETTYMAVKHVDAIGACEITVNVWATERTRASGIANEITARALTLKDAYGYPIRLVLSGSDIQMMQDTTVKPPLWRAIVTLQFTT